jgi:hypothetical protein
MPNIDPRTGALMLQRLLQPWHEAVKDPPKAQQEVLHRLLKDYARTDYGAQHGAAQIDGLDDYRRAFSIPFCPFRLFFFQTCLPPCRGAMFHV